MTLTDFLLARIAEDEAVAREAQAADIQTVMHKHMAQWNPARVLAECEAKRRIVNRENDRLREQWRRRVDEHRQTFDEWLQPPYGETLRDLASVYADHPDYDESWRP